MVKRPTVADLAEKAGVSIATVDRVLNRRLPVREDTAQRVVEAAEAIGYHAAGLLKQRLIEVPQRTFAFLLQKKDQFYQAFGAALAAETRAATFIRGKPVVEFTDEIAPAVIAARIREFGARADAMAVVSVDHPAVNGAVEEVAKRGTAVFTLLSDITAPSRAGTLSVDTRKAGRTAAWTIARLTRGPGKIAILIGSHRYLSQELAEISFRSYLREHRPDLQLLEPLVNLDDPRFTYEAVVDLVTANPDIIGLFAPCGGVDGLVRALREENAGGRITVVCNELTPMTRAGLIDGTVDMVIGTPIAALAQRTVAAMARATAERGGMIEELLPADIFISENI
jgi:LacI family transcriptional regulator